MYLMNGKNTSVKVMITDSSDDVLEVSCHFYTGIFHNSCGISESCKEN